MAATSPTPTDIDSVAYDAPLSFAEPSPAWVRRQTHKGSNRNRLTSASVPSADLRGKWVLISGANNGIGREAALQMAEWGANLVLACRDPPAKEIHPIAVVEECKARAVKAGVEKSVVEWWEVDMARLETVEALAERWLASGRTLDVLCNNAGIGSSPGGEKVFLTDDGFEIIHQVNFLSHVLLTLRLLPSMAAAAAPRIIGTTSCFHYLGHFDLSLFNGPDANTPATETTGRSGVQLYQNNKLWFQTWLTALQHRLLAHPRYRHVSVNGIHPGWVNSGIWNLNDPAVPAAVQYLVKAVSWVMGIDERQGSMAILNAVAGERAGPKTVTEQGGKEVSVVGNGGRYFNRVWEEEPMPHCLDRDCRGRVWRKVGDELGLREKGLWEGLEREDGD